jgi:hypothetical protein
MTSSAADGDPELTDPHNTNPHNTNPHDTKEQRIRVESGVAYGVLGADLHVWGPGVLLYLLETWRNTPSVDPEWLRRLPGRLLNARDGACFTGSAAELNQLRQWRDSAPRLAVRWLSGPAEADQTGLAATFARESAADTWKVVVATRGPGTVLPALDSQDLRLGAAGGVLLVIDDADQWPWNSLALLLSNRLFRWTAGGTRTRILMIGRTLDPWPGIQHKLISSGQPATSSQRMKPQPRADQGRVAGDCGFRDGR